MIRAKVLKHSTSYLGKEIVTFILEYPRYIHSELMTHRVFSKNSASSRAIPFPKFVEMVKLRPVVPIWTYNEKGMQGKVVEDHMEIDAMNGKWLEARDLVIEKAEMLNLYKVHKQNVNRLLEPWMHIQILLTGTDFGNWFNLRDHKDAHPEIQMLARAMKDALANSKAEFLLPGQWHAPFGDNIPEDDVYKMISSAPSMEVIPDIANKLKLKIATARCARTSYNNFDGGQDFRKDIELFDKLVVQEPLHASPAEHCNKVPFPNELVHMGSSWHYMSTCSEEQPEWHEVRGKYFSNLSGWIQLRKLIECGEFK